ncbi:unnamed protein product [Pararhodospirillum photometricum DSM 122]|uniref:Uncharacterized protein n=1 Tax=Pararhodospirillum photometricum DSM 122 TaxID=1150469 RepID=H6SPE0_PARPM|nr:unnamed protein product [Pararhodospirillum photometricum DSM 122]
MIFCSPEVSRSSSHKERSIITTCGKTIRPTAHKAVSSKNTAPSGRPTVRIKLVIGQGSRAQDPRVLGGEAEGERAGVGQQARVGPVHHQRHPLSV